MVLFAFHFTFSGRKRNVYKNIHPSLSSIDQIFSKPLLMSDGTYREFKELKHEIVRGIFQEYIHGNPEYSEVKKMREQNKKFSNTKKSDMKPL